MISDDRLRASLAQYRHFGSVPTDVLMLVTGGREYDGGRFEDAVEILKADGWEEIVPYGCWVAPPTKAASVA